MRILIYVTAGMFCLGSIIAAEESTTDQGRTQSNAKGKTIRIRVASTNNQGKSTDDGSNKKNLSSGGGGETHAATQGRGVFTISTAKTGPQVAKNSDPETKSNSKKKLSSGEGGNAQAGTHGRGQYAVRLDDANSGKSGKKNISTGSTHTASGQEKTGSKQSSVDAQGRTLVGNDQGVWRSGNPDYQGQHLYYQDTVTPSQSGNAHTGTSGRVTGIAVDPSDPSGQTGGKKIKKKSGTAGDKNKAGAKKDEGSDDENRADKNMTLKGKKILQN